MPTKSLISELPDIVRDGNREAAAILDRLSSPNRITLQTNELVLPAKATSAIRFKDNQINPTTPTTPITPVNQINPTLPQNPNRLI